MNWKKEILNMQEKEVEYGNYVEATGRIKVEIALKKAKGSPSLELLS